MSVVSFARRWMSAAVMVSVMASSLAACSDSTSGSVYRKGETGVSYKVVRGVVLTVREVEVKGSESGIGAATGAAAGGVGGYQIGGNRSMNVLGAIGGAVIGGLIGYAAEKGLTSETALEVVVQLDDGRTVGYVQARDDKDVTFTPGQRVIVMQGEKNRVVPDNSGILPPTKAPASSSSTSSSASSPATSSAPAATDLPPPDLPTPSGASALIKDGRN